MDKITMKGRIVDGKYFDEWYTRAVEESGYSHNLFKFTLNDVLPMKAYVIMHNGVHLEPEEVISRLQRLAELEGG